MLCHNCVSDHSARLFDFGRRGIQVRFANDVIAIEYRARFVAADCHRNIIADSGAPCYGLRYGVDRLAKALARQSRSQTFAVLAEIFYGVAVRSCEQAIVRLLTFDESAHQMPGIGQTWRRCGSLPSTG